MGIDPLDDRVTEALRAWAVQHGAGLGLAQALALCGSVAPPGRAQGCFEVASARASAGENIEQVLEALAPVLTDGERLILAAGWNAGRIDGVLAAVLEQRDLWTRTRRSMRAKMALPVLVLLLASFVAPLPAMVLGSVSLVAYFVLALAPMIAAFVLWRLGAALFDARVKQAAGSESRPAPPGLLDRLLLNLPVVAAIERDNNLSVYAYQLAQLLGAGVILSESLAACMRVVPNGHYRMEIFRARLHVQEGRTLSSGLRGGVLWPTEFIVALAVGEEAGKLEEVLLRLARQARERYARSVELLAEWIPRAAYGLVALYILAMIAMGVQAIGSLYSKALN
ncbi:MAG: type II secretion system F family protein [Planctomycetes bacterium]|nr:type II secretion system F family protein [Planctomycetota bacterium]